MFKRVHFRCGILWVAASCLANAGGAQHLVDTRDMQRMLDILAASGEFQRNLTNDARIRRSAEAAAAQAKSTSEIARSVEGIRQQANSQTQAAAVAERRRELLKIAYQGIRDWNEIRHLEDSPEKRARVVELMVDARYRNPDLQDASLMGNDNVLNFNRARSGVMRFYFEKLASEELKALNEYTHKLTDPTNVALLDSLFRRRFVHELEHLYEHPGTRFPPLDVAQFETTLDRYVSAHQSLGEKKAAVERLRAAPIPVIPTKPVKVKAFPWYLFAARFSWEGWDSPRSDSDAEREARYRTAKVIYDLEMQEYSEAMARRREALSLSTSKREEAENEFEAAHQAIEDANLRFAEPSEAEDLDSAFDDDLKMAE